VQQGGVKSLQSDRESLKEKLCLFIIGRDRSNSVVQIAIIIIISYYQIKSIKWFISDNKGP